MKSFEELVDIARNHSYPPKMNLKNPDFHDFLKYARNLVKKTVELYAFVDSQNEPQRKKLESFFEGYMGHKGKNLDELFEECQITNQERPDVEPFIETLDRNNDLFHAQMDLPYNCSITMYLEQLKTSIKTLKENKSKMSKSRYEEIMLNNITSLKEGISNFWGESRYDKKMAAQCTTEMGKLFLSEPHLVIKSFYNSSED